jgi:hypothetical protein
MAACVAALQRLEDVGQHFSALHIALLAEDNYLLLHLPLCAAAAQKSVEAQLVRRPAAPRATSPPPAHTTYAPSHPTHCGF